jgi:heat shock protein HtpX
MKRIVLFVATNVAVLLVLSIVLQVLGIESLLDEQGVGLNFEALLVFAAVLGMGGSFVSLLLSKWMAKRMTGARVIDSPQGAAETWLVQTVSKHARAAGIGMPEVAIYDGPEPNAFATGARRDKALVAVSTGLLRGMRENEVDAVIGHEISHVANGDLVTLTLIQGVVNTFVIFFARIIGHVVDRTVFRTERGYGPGYFLGSIVAQVVLGILATFIVAWFSRQREYRADAGGARLSGTPNMIGALERLKAGAQGALPDQLQAFGISGGGKGFMALMATHPPLDDRIARLRSQGGLSV